MKNIKAVILDWAGTSVDYGCMAPALVFVEIFHRWNINLTPEQARLPMGLAKKDHTRELLQIPEIKQQWLDLYGRLPKEKDVEDLFSHIYSAMSEIISEFAMPVPGCINIMEKLKHHAIKVGTTTGYMTEIMDLLIPEAARQGFIPDCVVSSSEVPFGRPAPYMCYLNAIKLNVFPFNQMVKIGDTVADIREGLNAGMWTIGVTKSGNEVGMSWDEINEADPHIVNVLVSKASQKMKDAGAHYVCEGIWDSIPILEEISGRISKGEIPANSNINQFSVSI
jgi:phosphonoacetaldehyde hydrolase